MKAFTQQIGRATVGGVAFSRELTAETAIELFAREIRERRIDQLDTLPERERRYALGSFCFDRYAEGRTRSELAESMMPYGFILWRFCPEARLGRAVWVVKLAGRIYVAAVLTTCPKVPIWVEEDLDVERLIARLGSHPLAFVELARGNLDRALSIAVTVGR